MCDSTDPSKRKRFIQWPTVTEKTTWGRTAVLKELWDPESSMYDADFPAPIPLGQRKTVWDEAEIDAYMERKAAKRFEFKAEIHEGGKPNDSRSRAPSKSRGRNVR